MRVIRLRFAAFATLATLVGVLCGGCDHNRPDHHSAVGPSATRTSPMASASATRSSPAASRSTHPRRLTGVMVSADSTAGRARVTYRPVKVSHVVDQYTEYLKIAVIGPQATLELRPDARILLRTPLYGKDAVASSVTTATFVAALARNRSQLPRIGFQMRTGADGRITYLEQIYQP